MVLKSGCILMILLTLIMAAPATVKWFADCGWRWAHVLGLSFSTSFFLTRLCTWLGRKWGIVDMPDARKLHHEPTPLLGGAAVFVGFAIAILINGIFTPKLWAILAACLVLFLIGLMDDIREIPAAVKLVAQLGCTVWIMFNGIVLRAIPDGFGLFAVLGNGVLTLLWIIGITNAMNFFDGMDGLAAGLGAIIAFFLGIVAFQTDQPFLGWIAAAMMGSCLGFLPHNFRIRGKANIFLGDAGSTVIGFVLASIAVYGEWAKDNPVVALTPPLLIFWILIFDMIHITIDRIVTGKVTNVRQWIEYVGRDHLHHRIAVVVGGNKRSVLFIYLLALCLGSGAVVLRKADSLDAILLLLQAAMMVILLTILEHRGRSISMEPFNNDIHEIEENATQQHGKRH